MRFRFTDLWRWTGTIDRGPYAVIGLLGFALKHNLDRLVATVVFEQKWGLFNYWISPFGSVPADSLVEGKGPFLATMVALALPFIWVGVALTVRRLRAAGLPAWLAVFFFAPFINLVFFVALSILPSRAADGRAAAWPNAAPRRRRLDRFIPDHPLGSAATGALLTNLVFVPLILLSTQVLHSYGWGLFVGLPFCLGLVSVLVHSYHGFRPLMSCLLVATASVLLMGALLLALAIEGVVCVVMAAPLATPLAWLGGAAGYVIQQRGPSPAKGAHTFPALVLALPALLVMEWAAHPRPPAFSVRTSIEVEASPPVVWRNVVSFSHLPEPEEWLFRLGIAYPIRAEIQGTGAGAERRCVFSTGAFVEPIGVWDEPRLLKFSVTSNPPPMQEWTPYGDLHPPHLDGFLVSRGGQFLLEPLPGGRTRLEGTTWYRHTMWPALYWRLWSDKIIHCIHLRVLRHIKREAETGAQSPLPGTREQT